MDGPLAQSIADRFDEFGLRFAEPVDLMETPHLDTIPATLTREQGRAAYRVGYADTLTFSASDWVKRHFGGGRASAVARPASDRT